MKSMLASMAVVLTFCAAPAAAAESPEDWQRRNTTCIM